VAIALGCFDIIRGLAHTIFVGHAAVELAGLDLTGPTGRDQLMLMCAFGSSNFITGAALIFLGLTNRFGALILLAVIPIALSIAGASIGYWGADLEGQGVFPGMDNMRIYVMICILTVAVALVMRWRKGSSRSIHRRQHLSAKEGE
jgi:hypothetical protein